MKESNKKNGMIHNVRQAVLVTVVLLLLCGFIFPVLLSGLSALIFPHQANGSLVTADGQKCGPGVYRGLLHVGTSLCLSLQHLL